MNNRECIPQALASLVKIEAHVRSLEWWDELATCYTLRGPGRLRADIHIEARRQRDGTQAWVVSNGCSTLNTDGEWEWEPSPSNRDDEYLARTRYATKEDALERYTEWESSISVAHVGPPPVAESST